MQEGTGMDFASAYNEFIELHLRKRTGEGRRRLQEGRYAERIFAEQVWWPAFETFDGLYPEFEVQDFRDGYRYIDYAYIHEHFRLAIEIDGVGPHWKNINKWQFADHLHRQNHLVIDGWRILRFSADDLTERPRVCQQTIHHLIGRILGGKTLDETVDDVMNREIIRFVIRTRQPVTPKQVARFLKVSTDSALKRLHELTEDRWLQSASGTQRVRSYTLHVSKRNVQI